MGNRVRTGMDILRDAAEAATLHKHPHMFWVRVDMSRIEKAKWAPPQLKMNVDQLFKDTDMVLAPLWKQMSVS